MSIFLYDSEFDRLYHAYLTLRNKAVCFKKLAAEVKALDAEFDKLQKSVELNRGREL